MGLANTWNNLNELHRIYADPFEDNITDLLSSVHHILYSEIIIQHSYCLNPHYRKTHFSPLGVTKMLPDIVSKTLPQQSLTTTSSIYSGSSDHLEKMNLSPSL